MDIKATGCNYNSPQFLGKVDSTVVKYVKAMKKEAKAIYVKDCENTGIAINPTAFKCIDERCNTALEKLNQKAKLLHKDTVIKTTTNPYKHDNFMYLSAENKNLFQEWEQKGAGDRISIYNNNLRDTGNVHSGYDKYITRFEGLVDKVNANNLDKSMIRLSISNLWNMSLPRILKKNFAEEKTNSIQKMANDIGYSTTFADSFREYLRNTREQINPPTSKKDKTSFFNKILDFFNKKQA